MTAWTLYAKRAMAAEEQGELADAITAWLDASVETTASLAEMDYAFDRYVDALDRLCPAPSALTAKELQ